MGGTISGAWRKASERKHPACGCQMQSQFSVSSCWEVEALGSEHARHQLVKITDPQTTSIFNPRHSLNSRSLNREWFYIQTIKILLPPTQNRFVIFKFLNSSQEVSKGGRQIHLASFLPFRVEFFRNTETTEIISQFLSL